MIQIINNLFSSWNREGVIYCSWKGNSHIGEAMSGKSDFDILIEAASLKKGKQHLKK